MTIAESLTRRIETVDHDQLPEAVRAVARLRLLDGLAVMAGGSAGPIAGVLERYLAAAGRGSGSGSVTPFPRTDLQLTLEDAGLLTGTYANNQNYADTSLRSVAHNGSIVVPTVVIGAQGRTITGRQAIEATVAGYEVMEHMAMMLNNGVPRMGSQLKGFRPTASCGAIGTVATLARLWGLDADTTRLGLGIATNYACGLRRHSGSGVGQFRMQSGEAIRHGVTATLLAMNGIDAHPASFEGSGAFLEAYQSAELDHATRERVENLSFLDDYTILDQAAKLHCTGHNLPAALDSLLDLKRDEALEPGDIERIVIEVPAAHAEIATHYAAVPDSPGAAGGNYRYCAGVVLATGDFVWPEHLAAHLGDPAVARVAGVTEVVADPDLTESFEHDRGSWPARVSVWCTDGRELHAERRTPFGMGGDERTRAAIERKFDLIATPVLGAAAADRVRALMDDLDRVQDVAGELQRAVTG